MSARGHQGILLAANPGVIADLPFDGPNNSTVFTDSTGRPWTGAGSAKLSTAQSVLGGSSLYLPGGSGDYLSTPQTTDLEFGAVDFEIEAFIRPASVTSNMCIAANWHGVAAAYCAWLLYVTAAGKLQLSVGYGAVNTGTPSTTSLVANVWTRVRAFRQGTAIRYEIGGALDTTVFNIGANALNSFAGEPTKIARAGGISNFNGYIDQFQIHR